MRSSVLRLTFAALLAFAVGCGVTDEDIDHWKHTVRGPGKITSVLVTPRYDQHLRVHAARALIEMKHPNANGLDLMVQAFASLPAPDREGIIHQLLPALEAQMRGAQQQQQSQQGPSEPQIQGKDAAYLIVHYNFASTEDRAELSTELLNWLLADLNTRALAGQYTADQIITAIGPTAADRLAQAFTANEEDVRVAVNIAQLINSVATDAGKDVAVQRLIAVATDVQSPAGIARLHTTAQQRAQRSPPPGVAITPEFVNRIANSLSGSYLAILTEAIHTLNRPAGTAYLISLAANPATPLDRRKNLLSAIGGQVTRANTDALLAIANNVAPTANTDIELRGLAIDRVGETHDPTAVPRLWTVFDTTNGGEANGEFQLRWKAGEAILKLGSTAILPQFVTHLTTPRHPVPPATFEGYTYAEINGYALTLGDFASTSREAVRGLLRTTTDPYVKAMSLLFLGARGEASDQALITAALADTTPITGPGWSAAQCATLGAVATHAQTALRRTLGQAGAPAAAPAQPAAAAPAAPAQP